MVTYVSHAHPSTEKGKKTMNSQWNGAVKLAHLAGRYISSQLSSYTCVTLYIWALWIYEDKIRHDVFKGADRIWWTRQLFLRWHINNSSNLCGKMCYLVVNVTYIYDFDLVNFVVNKQITACSFRLYFSLSLRA